MKTEIPTKELEEAMNAVLKQARKMEESDESEERRHGFGMESALTAHVDTGFLWKMAVLDVAAAKAGKAVAQLLEGGVNHAQA